MKCCLGLFLGILIHALATVAPWVPRQPINYECSSHGLMDNSISLHDPLLKSINVIPQRHTKHHLFPTKFGALFLIIRNNKFFKFMSIGV